MKAVKDAYGSSRHKTHHTGVHHTGQNYDYSLNGVFFKDLELDDPELYLDAVGDDLGETMGNIISSLYARLY